MPKSQQTKKLQVRVSKDPQVYVGQYLTLLNGLMQLHPRQLRVLIAIANAGGKVTTQVRKDIRKQLNFRTSDALNMMIHELKLQGILLPLKKRGEFRIAPVLTPQRLDKLIFEFYEGDDDKDQDSQSV